MLPQRRLVQMMAHRAQEKSQVNSGECRRDDHTGAEKSLCIFQTRQEHSQHDKQFMHTVTTSAQLVDGHFCFKLPLKDEKVKMPCNRGIAEQRLNSLKRNLSRTTDFFEEYKAFMNNILEKGYATRVPKEQLSRSDGRVWFIPHHGVYHPWLCL